MAKATAKTGKAEQTRERIMRAAARLFRDKGYTGTTMRDIARKGRMKAGSIYYHFPSKETLVDTILEMGLNDVVIAVKGAVDALPPAATAGDRLGAAIDAQFRALNEIGDYAIASRRIFSQIPTKIRNKHLQLREEFANYWQDLFVAAQRGGCIDPALDIRICRSFVLGAVNWSVEWFDPKVKPIDHVAEQFVRMAFGGFRQGAVAPAQPAAAAPAADPAPAEPDEPAVAAIGAAPRPTRTRRRA